MFFGTALTWETIWHLVQGRHSKTLELEIRSMQTDGKSPIQALGAILNYDASEKKTGDTGNSHQKAS